MIEAARLKNWGRWLRSHYHSGQAWSLEGNYRNKDDDGTDALTRPGRQPSPIESDAWDIEIACRMLPVKHHVLLKLRYVARMSDDDIAKAMRKELKLRLSASDVDASEGMALVLLEDALYVPAVVRMERAQAAVRRILRLYPLTLEPECL